jgi:hypothetical protein
MEAGASTSETLWIALAGGTIGVLITGVAWTALKLLGIPGDLRRHDFEARVINEDLELWAIDQYRQVRRELRQAENSPSQVDWIYSGAYGNARSYIKTNALHRWRDRLHSAERSMVEIESKEGSLHRLVRRREKYREGLALRAAERVEPIIEEFRQPITKHGHDHLQVFDPTTVRLEDVIEQIEKNPLEPDISPTVEYLSDGGGGRRRIVHDEPPAATDDLPGLSGPMTREDSAP